MANPRQPVRLWLGDHELAVLQGTGLYAHLHLRDDAARAGTWAFLLALAVNTLHRWLKGVVIFATLLPFIVTPMIGSLVLFWMIDANGIIGSSLALAVR